MNTTANGRAPEPAAVADFLGDDPVKLELYEAAIALHERGLPIVLTDSKKPMGGAGWQKRPFVPALAPHQLKGAKEPGIGLKFGPESGIVDIEADGPEEEALVGRLFDGAELPITPAYRSTRGVHRLFRFDERLQATGQAVVSYRNGGPHKLGCRIGAGDLGAQSVIPPSPGREWLPGLSLDEVDPAPLPEGVVQRILAAASKHRATAEQGQADHGGNAHTDALRAMKRSTKAMQDGNDGSKRLFCVCCRAVEFDLPDNGALATIRAYERSRPFTRNWSDSEILQRLRDAEDHTERGKALVVRRELTDMGNAERFAALHGGDVRYLAPWGKWFIFNGRRWKVDDTGAVMRLAKRTAKSIYAEAAAADDSDEAEAIAAFAKRTQARGKLDAMLELAKSEEPIPAAIESFDSDPWLLNFDNGTVDLRTGLLRPHERGDLITRTTGTEYPDEPGVDAVLWLDFLDAIFNGDAELIRFLQRLMGSALVGVVQEHILPIFYGTGANGKSVFIETVMAALGEYAMKAPAGLLMSTRGERHPTELADLYGRRLVAITETGDGQRLDERLVKETTGGDTIRARRMREDFWQFTPSHLSVLVTNYQPIVRGTDYGIWRRLRLVPFTVTIPEDRQDKELPQKLRSELPAIAAWMVAGCLDWQRQGLRAPAKVMAATEGYKHDSDTFAQWFEEHMKVEPWGCVKASAAFKSYQAWCEERNERSISNRRFGERMGEKITAKRLSNGTWYEGIAFSGQ